MKHEILTNLILNNFQVYFLKSPLVHFVQAPL